jgi:UDP-N-acetylmuramate: L-alanyl-gamma-D-glutamyl-meso-diaminopimelate ligase
MQVCEGSPAPVESFGLGEGFTWGARDVEHGPEGCRFTVLRDGAPAGEGSFPSPGDHMVRNGLAVWGAATRYGLSAEEISRGLATFPGVRRRMDLRAEVGGVAVLEDFAHHPTAIRETLRAARHRFPGRRLWACFEPRSWTCRRRVHQETFPEALAEADRVLLAPVFEPERLPPDDRLDAGAVADAIRERGREAAACGSVDEIVKVLLEESREGDVVLLLSNGSFEGLPERLPAELREREARG